MSYGSLGSRLKFEEYRLSSFNPVNPMKVTLDLDETLINEALHLTKLTTQEELLTLALRELVKSRRKKDLLETAGQVQFVPDFDHKDLRETRHAAD
jgi:Arc/MetJ family transcription regulator